MRHELLLATSLIVVARGARAPGTCDGMVQSSGAGEEGEASGASVRLRQRAAWRRERTA